MLAWWALGAKWSICLCAWSHSPLALRRVPPPHTHTPCVWTPNLPAAPLPCVVTHITAELSSAAVRLWLVLLLSVYSLTLWWPHKYWIVRLGALIPFPVSPSPPSSTEKNMLFMLVLRHEQSLSVKLPSQVAYPDMSTQWWECDWLNSLSHTLLRSFPCFSFIQKSLMCSQTVQGIELMVKPEVTPLRWFCSKCY